MSDKAVDPLFTQEIVMEFILSKNEAKVTNLELVNHFKNFLNDPIRKVENRQQFKVFVNNLTNVKLNSSGEKFLVLKKKFKDEIVYANEPSIQKNDTQIKTETVIESIIREEASQPVCLPATLNQIDTNSKNDLIVNNVMNEIESQLKIDVIPLKFQTDHTKINDDIKEPIGINSEISKHEVNLKQFKDQELMIEKDIIDGSNLKNSTQRNIFKNQQLPEKEFAISIVPMFGSDDFSNKSGKKFEPKEVKNFKKENDNIFKDIEINRAQSESKLTDLGEALKGLNLSSVYLTKPTSDSILTNQNQIVDSKKQKSLEVLDQKSIEILRVKDVALNFNRIENETNKLNGAISTLAANNKTKRETRKAMTGESNLDNDMSPLTSVDREWILKSASSDYQVMNKILQQNPHLAKKRDFITGYTALHWAAKNGQADVIKLLCGKYSADINQRTQGGYTPLHLASQAGHEHIIEILIRVYGADANIRDYSGRLAKFYLSNSASSQSQHLMMPRKPVSTINNIIPLRTQKLERVHSLNNGKENTPTSLMSLNPFRYEDYSNLMPPPTHLPNIIRQKPKSKKKKVPTATLR